MTGRPARLEDPSDLSLETAMSASSTLTAVRTAFAEHAGAPCGPDDNFFAIGGDSFRAAVCVYALRELGLTVALKDLFECKTAADLAGRIDAQTAA